MLAHRSPSRKRMRLSSPTFDDQVTALSQDDIAAFDAVDAQLSQHSPGAARSLPVEDEGDPFRAETAHAHAPITSASAIASSHLELEPPPDTDYAAWFSPDVSSPFVGFSAATTAMPGFQRPSIGGANAKVVYVPSAAALREAEDKMKKWQEDPDPVRTHSVPSPPPLAQAASPPRATFSSARNALSSIHPPETPTSASSPRPANVEPASTRSHSSLQTTHRQPKPFRSPLVGAMPSQRQPSTPNVGSPLRDRHSSASQVMTAVAPLRPSSVANHVTIQKPLGFTPVRGTATARPKFVTPFKVVAKSKPSSLENPTLTTTPTAPPTPLRRIYPPSIPFLPQSKPNSDRRVFDLTPPSSRRSLATSGLWPQSYTVEQLEDMGINFKELSQVNLRTAPFYAFATRLRSPPNASDPPSAPVWGRLAALEELHARGCTLAKQAWVDNHWPLVLWKLAGMVSLDPVSESDPLKKRWCWPEVIRQLTYRYERDLNSASRPPLRLITTRDASAESPMVLCVTDIIWPASGPDDIAPVQTYPDLEVTDGWYRLRVRIDAPITRGVRKGKIKVGRKIAVAGAKLLAERKEGSEILEAYNSNVLLLTGNSTHMAPWHAKLGFQHKLFVATLNSLSPDGGNVAIMMLTITKAYPVAYIEFTEDPDGRKQREGPYDEKEELRLSAQWKTKRDSHASRLWSEYEKRRYRLLDHAEHLEQRASSKFRPKHDDCPPDTIDDMYDTLQEDPEAAKNIISSISHEDAGWLARHIRERVVQERDGVSKGIEQELESICPPRDVKTFCVVVVSDTRTYKHPPKRAAQITVWDVPGVSVSEGYTQKPFSPGQRYLVTNLVPTQRSAWMDRSSVGEVYLSTRKNSKWKLVN